MALNYGDNYVFKIKKGNVEYEIQDAKAKAAIETIQGDASTEGSIAKALADAATDATTKADAAKAYADGLASHYDAAGSASAAETAAKTYAKGLVDKILGEDSAASTLESLKSVIAELNDPANANGITGTFIDSVKTAITGLTKDDGQGGTTTATVKEYVDNAVSAASSSASSAIAALDATAAQTAGTDGLALSVTEENGKITAISGSIAANTYDAYGAASTVQSTLIGTNSDASSADTINGAKAYADAAIAAQTQSSVTDHVLILGL